MEKKARDQTFHHKYAPRFPGAGFFCHQTEQGAKFFQDAGKRCAGVLNGKRRINRIFFCGTGEIPMSLFKQTADGFEGTDAGILRGMLRIVSYQPHQKIPGNHQDQGLAAGGNFFPVADAPVENIAFPCVALIQGFFNLRINRSGENKQDFQKIVLMEGAVFELLCLLAGQRNPLKAPGDRKQKRTGIPG